MPETNTRVTTDVPVKNPNLFWKEFSANEVSHSMAHYLVTLRDLRASQGYARKTDIADELGVTKGTVSQQIRHLKERGYVIEDKAHHLDLTEAGQSVARQVIYNRGTLIRFLNKVLRVDAKQAEVDACKMEHLLSPVASHKLLGLVQLLLSGDDSANALLEKYSKLLAEIDGKSEGAADADKDVGNKKGAIDKPSGGGGGRKSRRGKTSRRKASGKKTAGRKASGKAEAGDGKSARRPKSKNKKKEPQ